MFEYHCNCCGYDFFMEEGYNGELDAIICPMCGAERYDEDGDTFIEETVRETYPPCPKCGNQSVIVEGGYNGKWTVKCRHNITCGYTTDEYNTKEEAIKAWSSAKQMKKVSLHITEITGAQINKAIQCLMDNGIDEDDAYEILEALGYILLDGELFQEVL